MRVWDPDLRLLCCDGGKDARILRDAPGNVSTRSRRGAGSSGKCQESFGCKCLGCRI